MKRVYVAGPYTHGDVEANVREAIAASDMLLEAGYAPYCPHMSHFWHRQHPHDYETWMALDMAWLAQCDALIRLPGESPGADREVLFAQHHNIPVYYGWSEFLIAEVTA